MTPPTRKESRMTLMREYRGGGPVDGLAEQIQPWESDEESVGIPNSRDDKSAVAIYRRTDEKTVGDYVYYFFEFAESVPEKDAARVLAE